MLFFKREKYYTLAPVINGENYPVEYFSTRAEAIKRMSHFLDVEEVDVDYVIKRERNHFCEYVCTDGRSRFFINRVMTQKKEGK